MAYYKKSKTPEQMFDIKQEKIDLRCNIKDKNIAFFNSINSAIQMTNAGKSIKDNKDQKWTDILVDWRNWFYHQWEMWYLRETTPQAINMKKAVALGNKWKEKMAQSDAEFSQVKGELQEDEINKKFEEEVAEYTGEEIPIVEEPDWDKVKKEDDLVKELENNQPEQQAERQFEEKQRNK